MNINSVPGPGRGEWKDTDPEHLEREAQDSKEGEPWLLGGTWKLQADSNFIPGQA